ncbi:hypothetical protein [Rummeliibacillus suwonensis]|uniref:hypothetical protein n=1 Tax=Rummeliibacillus suwonensis TaxID=1306154 RepID=UPI002896A975|nr:hypothetical protein [Rummeliibacillus suwonensis]
MNYREIILETIQETYPKYLQQKLIKKLEENCIITKTNDLLSISNIAIMNTPQNHFKTIKDAIDINTTKTLEIIEKMEFEVAYKYSVLFELNKPLTPLLHEMIKKNLITQNTNSQYTNDSVSDNIINGKPTIINTDKDVIILKFSNLITGFSSLEAKKKAVKYPILVLYYREYGVIEIKLDTIKSYLKNGNDNFYIDKINAIKDWFYKNSEDFALIPFNLVPIVDFIAKNKSKEVELAAQAMNYMSGSKVTLDTGKNNTPILPLLGDLKKIISENDELFDANDETKQIGELLNKFIKQTEDTADLPWISLRWPNSTKSKIIRVKFSFNEKNSSYDMLQYYDTSNTEMGRMIDVTKYIIENRAQYELSKITTSGEEEIS